jgi:hypothetical protein
MYEHNELKKKENVERDEKRLNARYPTPTRDSYVPWDV